MENNISDLKFKRYFEDKVKKAIRKYKLFTKKDRVAVAVSGGKDSITCLYILKKLGYNVEAITIDAAIGNYSKNNLENIKKFCKEQDINLHVVSFRGEFGRSLCYMRSVLTEKGHKYSSCMLCGILKRYLLNKHARKLKFDFLATGHNLDDEAQAFLMNVFRNDYTRAIRQGPKPGISKTEKFVGRVKPLYLLTEEETKKYSKLMGFPVNYEICPCSVNAYRRQYINILNDFEKKHPSVKYNILRFHEKIAANLKEQANGKIEFCKSCGEPASKDLCKTCEIFKDLES
jgi:tRNA-5-methyluridine54 2-sulfurtransferase